MQIRLGCHDLNQSTARQLVGAAREPGKLCKCCNRGTVETPLHTLLECPFYISHYVMSSIFEQTEHTRDSRCYLLRNRCKSYYYYRLLVNGEANIVIIVNGEASNQIIVNGEAEDQSIVDGEANVFMLLSKARLVQNNCLWRG